MAERDRERQKEAVRGRGQTFGRLRLKKLLRRHCSRHRQTQRRTETAREFPLCGLVGSRDRETERPTQRETETQPQRKRETESRYGPGLWTSLKMTSS